MTKAKSTTGKKVSKAAELKPDENPADQKAKENPKDVAEPNAASENQDVNQSEPKSESTNQSIDGNVEESLPEPEPVKSQTGDELPKETLQPTPDTPYSEGEVILAEGKKPKAKKHEKEEEVLPDYIAPHKDPDPSELHHDTRFPREKRY